MKKQTAAKTGIGAASQDHIQKISVPRIHRRVRPAKLSDRDRGQRCHGDLARLYEARKAAWIAEHPDASCSAYETAMRQICDDIGF